MTGEPPPGFKKLLTGTNWREVRSAVGDANWVVSPNPRCRTKGEKERWVLARLLCAPEAEGLLQPPLKVYEGDKPDFWIMTCDKTVGVEVAEIVHEIDAVARTVAQDNKLESYFAPHPQDFPTRRERKKLPQTMQNGGSGWTGSDPELSFAELACSLIVKKSRKHSDYTASDASLLLLYKNTGFPLPDRAFDRSGAREKITSCAKASRRQFERVAIWMGQNLLVF